MLMATLMLIVGNAHDDANAESDKNGHGTGMTKIFIGRTDNSSGA